MSLKTIYFLALAFAILPATGAISAPFLECTVILEAGSGKTVHREGTCDKRFAPASSFKVPLAVIGYDAGILADPHNPAWKWHKGLTAPERDRKTVDPTIWERDSVLWYSREITAKLGQQKFADYISRLNYGNADVSGDKGQNNGLTHSWLGASLEISPDEQAKFMRGLLLGQLPVSAKSQEATRAILPVFEAERGWRIQGKTGSVWLRDKKGERDRNRPTGWFVGWAEKNGQRYVFARFTIGNGPASKPAGPALRDDTMKTLPALLER